jgi:very-short-patch-repair endonuclease
LVLVLAGLAPPVTQHVIRTADGRFVARVDLAYVEANLVVEYDGAWHWQQRRRDDRRRDALRALGWTVLVFSAEDVYRHPADIVVAVESALRRAA